MMKLQTELKKWMAAFCIAMLLSMVSGVVSFADTCAEIRTDSFRLHILANSDSAQDQEIKLAVRDELLAQTNTLFSQSDSKQSAMETVAIHLDEMEQIANQVLLQYGKQPTAKAELCRMYFTTRYYEDYTLPAGEYDALRVTLGQAKGHNWWCVLYPSLCLPGATKQENLQQAYDQSEQDVVANGEQYQFRFAIVEWLEQLKKEVN